VVLRGRGGENDGISETATRSFPAEPRLDDLAVWHEDACPGEAGDVLDVIGGDRVGDVVIAIRYATIGIRAIHGPSSPFQSVW
jgi:hypothetical protein